MGKTDSFYETFDSAGGPLIPEGDKDNFAHKDNGKGSYTSNAIDDEQGSVPEVPTKSR